MRQKPAKPNISRRANSKDKTNNAPGMEWLGLRELTKYAAVSERTLRTWIHSIFDPLPVVQARRKILISRKAFDAWLRAHTLKPANALGLTGPLSKERAFGFLVHPKGTRGDENHQEIKQNVS
jgi:hypothetical protein